MLHVVVQGQAQTDSLRTLDPIQVIARPSLDSIMLRWAPIETRYWLAANRQGYTIERYTLVRDGKALAQPEKRTLTPTPIKPFPEPQWEQIVVNNKYATIAAQALLGETFELDLKQSGAFSIVNKVKENEQRFSIALFCADLNVQTAKALALYYADKDVKKGEKYLYRIISKDAKSKTILGSVFVAPDDPHQLPVTPDFSIDVQGSVALLRWDQSLHKRIYTAYQVERSEDGKTFKAVFEDPITTLSPTTGETKFQYANDTLQDLSKEYHYRVKGLSPFGEAGPPSEVQKIKGKRIIKDLPYITSAASKDNKTITVAWEFGIENNNWIDGFFIERSVSPSGIYNKAHEGMLPKEARSFDDTAPKQTNYYRIIALTANKEELRSMTYYAQLVDSIPPAPPVGFKGEIDEHGNVNLSWKHNSEEDIYGYRVYRAYYTSDEFAQLTSGPIKSPQFKDKVNLQSLNEKIHYRIMAIDNSQNHSDLSEVYSLLLPDKVPPVTPVFLPVQSSEEGVELSWAPSSSSDVVKYELYRKGDADQWIRLTSMTAGRDSIYKYTDTSLKNGMQQYYTVVAVDETNLESPPSIAVMGQKIKKRVWPPVSLADPQIDKGNNKMMIRWAYEQKEVRVYQIYKAVNDEPLKLYRSVSAKEFTDVIRPGSRYQYKVVAVFADGSRSEMGKGVGFTF